MSPAGPLLSCLAHLGLSDLRVHGVVGFEDFLRLLLGSGGRERFRSGIGSPRPAPPRGRPRPWPPGPAARGSQAQLLPTLEEVLGRHLRRLEELVDGHRELQGEGLGGAPIPAGRRGERPRVRPRPRPESPAHQPAPRLPTHRKRTDRSGGVRKSRRHSMLSTCCT